MNLGIYIIYNKLYAVEFVQATYLIPATMNSVNDSSRSHECVWFDWKTTKIIGEL